MNERIEKLKRKYGLYQSPEFFMTSVVLLLLGTFVVVFTLFGMAPIIEYLIFGKPLDLNNYKTIRTSQIVVVGQRTVFDVILNQFIVLLLVIGLLAFFVYALRKHYRNTKHKPYFWLSYEETKMIRGHLLKDQAQNSHVEKILVESKEYLDQFNY